MKACKKCGNTIFRQPCKNTNFFTDVARDITFEGEHVSYGKYYCDQCGISSWNLDDLLIEVEESKVNKLNRHE